MQRDKLMPILEWLGQQKMIAETNFQVLSSELSIAPDDIVRRMLLAKRDVYTNFASMVSSMGIALAQFLEAQDFKEFDKKLKEFVRDKAGLCEQICAEIDKAAQAEREEYEKQSVQESNTK